MREQIKNPLLSEVIKLELNTKECDAVIKNGEWVHFITFTTQDYSEAIENGEHYYFDAPQYNPEGEYVGDVKHEMPLTFAMESSAVLVNCLHEGMTYEIVASEMVSPLLRKVIEVEDGKRIRDHKAAVKAGKDAQNKLSKLFENHFKIRA